MGTALATSGTVSLAPVAKDANEVSSEDILSKEKRDAYVLIIGKGVMSHWASVWIFEDGAVYSVVLSAIDERTRSRWVRCRYKMRELYSGQRNETKCEEGLDLEANVPTENEATVERSDMEANESVHAALRVIWSEDAAPNVQESIAKLAKFVKDSGTGYYIMTPEPIHIQQTSPWKLRKRASKKSSLPGAYEGPANNNWVNCCRPNIAPFGGVLRADLHDTAALVLVSFGLGLKCISHAATKTICSYALAA